MHVKSKPETHQQETPPGSMQVMRRYFTVNKKYTPILVSTIFFSLLTSAMLSLMTQCFHAIIDQFGATGTILNKQTTILLLALVVFIPFQYLQQFLGMKYSELCDRNLRNTNFAIVSGIDMRLLDGQDSGDILSRANSDLIQINESLQNYFSVKLPQQIIGIVAFVASLYISWQLTLFSLAVVPAIAFLQVRISVPLTRFVQQWQQAAGESLSVANHLMGGYEIAKSYQLGDFLRQRYEAAVDRAADSGIQANRATILLAPLSQVLVFLPQIIICGFGVYLASVNQITSGGVMSVIILSVFIGNPIGDLSSVLSAFTTARGCATRVFELWDLAPEPTGGKATEPVNEVIRFSDVVFSYGDPSSPVLRGVSFTILHGEHIALVGTSGSGKSTALKLLMALYRKNEGEIEIFGHAVEEWATDALREFISYVGQDTYLFAGTLWDNFAMGNPRASDAQIQAAIDAALLQDIDMKRDIGERGMRLSGGQRQRVAIARAMLKDAPLLLLDEPTSALDTQSEALVSEGLRRLMHGRTTIIIAHRLSALRHIDRVLCLHDGQIVESGTHEQLMAMQGVYHRLYKSQEAETHD
ncbi:ABC transporter ATP-binding protein [Paenibacillus sp. CF384]|uniref:ABC transporter ATP-binding protein n=1 Tax=Paenibacillus sp. CF384 TaxID=1884382 RepID=UPI000898A559|nr:ABC transporter ATP-binding protein [Paenibacillus sp. CF384]SDX49138.1 ATP-binding cassette, subfamily B/ATP-binding cassette, subfamily B, MsbA/ATP-binding cassette, subfamily B, AbcA/BmrA [Paenibacillus sp. CF384]